MKNTSKKTNQLVRSYQRCLALIAGGICASAPLANADYESEILSEGPLAYYRFNDGVTSAPFDYADNLGSFGASSDFIYASSAIRPVAGALIGSSNTATRVSGTGASIPYQAALNPLGSFTVEIWLKPNIIPATGALISPISSWRENTDTFGREGWLVYQGDANTGFNFRTYNKNGGAVALSINSGTGVTAGAWHHVVVTWNHSAAVGKIYVNGVLKNTSPVVAPAGTNSRTFDPNTSGAFTIGSRSDGAFAWAGDTDEAAFYTTALSDAQVLAHYNNGINASPSPSYDAVVLADSPAAYLRLDDPLVTPPVAANLGSLSTSANGGYYGGASNTNTGPSSAAGFLGFGSTNSALSLPNANGNVSTLLGLLSNRSKFTVTGWVKRGAVKSTRGGYFGQNDTLEFGDAGGGTQIEAWNAAAGGITTPAPYPIADNTWGQITYTADGTAVRMYINGVQVAVSSGNISNYGASAFKFNIGGGGIFNASGDFFRGEIDEVAVFDKALSEGRVKQLYDTAVGTVPPTVANAPTVTPSAILPEGASYTMAVDPAGTPPFTYQWKRDGVIIPGAESKTYTVSSATVQTPPNDPFDYTCEVTNPYGSVTSASLFIYVTPALVWQGADGTSPTLWDIGTTANWIPLAGGSATTYSNDFSVLLNDSATSTSILIPADVEPEDITINNSSKNYTFEASDYGIGGALNLTKNGSGTLTLLNNNYYSGQTIVNAGILQLGDGTSQVIANTGSVVINGGTTRVNLPNDGIYENPTTIGAAGTLVLHGTGNLILSGGTISGTGLEIFDRNGITTVNRANLVTAASILQGEVIFTGNQEGNRMAVNGTVTVSPAAKMTIKGVNALPTGVNSIDVVLDNSTLSVVTGSGSHGHLRNLALNRGVIELASDAGGAYNGESFQLNGNLSVTGSGASTITFSGAGNASNSGVALKGTPIFLVPNVTGDSGADLIISAELEASDDNLGAFTKTGAGTLFLANEIAHSFTGATTISEGTLVATGSLGGDLSMAASTNLIIGDGIATFAARNTTLAGTYFCNINAAASDRLAVTGNLTLSAGSSIQITAVSPSAPFYIIASYTGNLTDGGVSISGVPAGYEVVTGFNSILISKESDFSPNLSIASGNTPGTLSSDNFNTNNAGFTVSTSVSAETDWLYSDVDGTWRSNGQNSASGSNNVSYLTSPVFTLTKPGLVELTFAHHHSFEFYAPADAYDGGVVEVSFNGGNFQRVPLSSFTQNGYNGTVMLGTSIELAGQPAFISNSAGHPAFITSKCKIAAGKAGDTVQVRFMSASDNNTSGDLTPAGWEIDSFEITESNGAGGMISWPLGILEYSDNLLPPWTSLGTGGGPIFIDTTVAPKRFFRVRP
jgi:autotransporter-associated beta strand protein